MVKDAAPECGLYIRVADDFQIEEMVEKLRQVFFAAKQSAYKKHMHVLELPAPGPSPEKKVEIAGLVGYGQHSGFVVLLRNDAATALELTTDGILLNNLGGLANARELLGADSIIGLQCGGDRDLAEKAIALDVDYVTFSNPLTLIEDIAWWVTKSEKPILADTVITNDNCAPYVRVGATFVNATEFLLSHPKGQMRATVDILFAVDLALKNRMQ